MGIDIDEDINELSMLEFIHNMVETLDKYFENVCELDVSRFSLVALMRARKERACLGELLLRANHRCLLVARAQIMFNIEKAHFIIDEMVMSGYIVETNKTNILNPVVTVVKASMQ